MTKDRNRRRRVARDVRIVVERSSVHPVEYAILLLVERGGVWHTVRTFDNAHVSDEHHEHCYVGSEKQPPIVTHGPSNEAMHAAEIKLLEGWSDIVRSWESTR
ncbi:MAG TPA: hypothetical protein VFY36_09635 [Solirubrobacteraceae bacterium]|nr:hypothetical protein [Solirubrobacteraceae bacterium]